MSTPTPILIARAIYSLEQASLELKDGRVASAAQSIETAVEYLEGIES